MSVPIDFRSEFVFDKQKFCAWLVLNNYDPTYGFYFSGCGTTNLCVQYYWAQPFISRFITNLHNIYYQ